MEVKTRRWHIITVRGPTRIMVKKENKNEEELTQKKQNQTHNFAIKTQNPWPIDKVAHAPVSAPIDRKPQLELSRLTWAQDEFRRVGTSELRMDLLASASAGVACEHRRVYGVCAISSTTTSMTPSSQQTRRTWEY